MYSKGMESQSLMRDMAAQEGEQQAFMPPHLANSNTPFKYGRRERKDVGYALLFALVLVAMCVGGIYATTHRNKNFESVVRGDLNISLAVNCPNDDELRYQARYFIQGDDGKPEFDAEGAVRLGLVWVLSSLLVAVGLGCTLVYVFIKKSEAAMKLTVAVQVGSPLILALVFIGQGYFGASIFMFVVTAVNALLFYLYRRQLGLCTKLLEVAACGLRDNHMLVPTVLALKVLGLLFIVPSIGFAVLAIANGELVPNKEVSSHATDGTCIDDYGEAVNCCEWKTDDWAFPFIAFCVFGIAWTFNVIFQIRLFTSSSALVQWYYTPVGLHQQSKAISTGLWHAFGPQFGTICFGGLVLTIVDYIRSLSQNLRDSRQSNGGLPEIICRWVMAMALDCVAAMIDFLTKFTTITASITGDSLCVAAHDTYDLLTRNFLSSLSVWWIPSTVLGVMVFTLSAIWTVITFLVLWAVKSHAMGAVVVITIITFFLTFTALSFVATMLTLAVDVCYVCYALDLDSQQQSNKAVHEVFDEVRREQPVYKQTFDPSEEGRVISQPGGGYAYGA